MAFNPSELAQALSSGYAKPSSYVVTFFPNWVLGLANLDLLDMSFMCQKVQLSGRSFAATPHQIYGVTRKIPHGLIYQDLSVTFICDQDMRPRKFMDQWQSQICSPIGNYFGYISDYSSRILVSFLNDSGVPTYNQYFEEAFPISVLSQDLSYRAKDEALMLTVQFAYRRWLNDADLIESALGVSGSGITDSYGTPLPAGPIGNTTGVPNYPGPSIPSGSPLTPDNPAAHAPTIDDSITQTETGISGVGTEISTGVTSAYQKAKGFLGF